MKLIRYGQPGTIKTGIILDGIKYDTSGFGEDYNEAFFENDGLERLQQYVEEHKNSLQVIGEDVRLDAPVARPSKIICIGL
ncbi:MAG TPA: ureidoglycolate lyase, partial [Niabella sp.]